MASTLARGKLARLAARLNEGGRKRGGRALPPLILMTDDARLPDPLAAARLLPKGSAIILRHRDAAVREILAQALKAIARRRGLVLLIAGDGMLAARIRADGLHLPEARMKELAHWRAARPSWLITVAVHSERALLRAGLAHADAALLAPVFASRSHPDRPGIGPLRTRSIALRARVPIYAMGGIGAANAARLGGARLAGIAAIEGLIPNQSA